MDIQRYFTHGVDPVTKDKMTESKVLTLMGMHHNNTEPTHRKAKPPTNTNY